jgi:hypothetical protein
MRLWSRREIACRVWRKVGQVGIRWQARRWVSREWSIHGSGQVRNRGHSRLSRLDFVSLSQVTISTSQLVHDRQVVRRLYLVPIICDESRCLGLCVSRRGCNSVEVQGAHRFLTELIKPNQPRQRRPAAVHSFVVATDSPTIVLKRSSDYVKNNIFQACTTR